MTPRSTRFYLWGLACSLVCGISDNALAQDAAKKPEGQPEMQAPQPGSGRPPGVIDRNHRLGPGDVVDIIVEDHPEYSAPNTMLLSDGSFDMPVLGTVQAIGLTMKELEDRVRDGMKKELRRPQVRVRIRSIYQPPPKEEKKPEIPKFSVLGAVSKRGIFELPEPKYLRTIIAMVDPTQTADLTQIKISYPDKTEKFADFSEFNVTGTSKDDVLIKGGEEIFFAERKTTVVKRDPIRVTILGAVAKPTTLEVPEGTTLLEALYLVGNATPGADLEKVEVSGPSHAKPVLRNVEAYMDGNVAENYVIKNTDVIKVPERPLKVLVFGEVPKQGEVAINEGERLIEVYLRAGGKTSTGDESRAQLIRRGPDGKPITKDVNIRDIMKQQDSKSNVAMLPGDVLFIPNKKIKRGLTYYLSAVASPLWLLRGPGTGLLGGF